MKSFKISSYFATFSVTSSSSLCTSSSSFSPAEAGLSLAITNYETKHSVLFAARLEQPSYAYITSITV